MPREFALLDALVPTLLVVFILCIALQAALNGLFSRLGVYRHIWHPPLFQVSLFVCMFGVFGLLILR